MRSINHRWNVSKKIFKVFLPVQLNWTWFMAQVVPIIRNKLNEKHSKTHKFDPTRKLKRIHKSKLESKPFCWALQLNFASLVNLLKSQSETLTNLEIVKKRQNFNQTESQSSISLSREISFCQAQDSLDFPNNHDKPALIKLSWSADHFTSAVVMFVSLKMKLCCDLSTLIELSSPRHSHIFLAISIHFKQSKQMTK